jgi:hypothetical protein
MQPTFIFNDPPQMMENRFALGIADVNVVNIIITMFPVLLASMLHNEASDGIHFRIRFVAYPAKLDICESAIQQVRHFKDATKVAPMGGSNNSPKIRLATIQNRENTRCISRPARGVLSANNFIFILSGPASLFDEDGMVYNQIADDDYIFSHYQRLLNNWCLLRQTVTVAQASHFGLAQFQKSCSLQLQRSLLLLHKITLVDFARVIKKRHLLMSLCKNAKSLAVQGCKTARLLAFLD